MDKVEKYNFFIHSLVKEFNKMKKNSEFSQPFAEILSSIYKKLAQEKNSMEMYSLSEKKSEDSVYTSIVLLNRKKGIKINDGLNKKLSIEEKLDPSIREILYSPLYNTDREKLREKWISLGIEYNCQGDKPNTPIGVYNDHFIFFDPEKVNHLKIFLTKEEKENAKNSEEGKKIFPMKEKDFKEFLSDNYTEIDLENLEKLISSFSTIKTKMADKPSKIRLIRDLRFGRITLESIKDEIEKKRAEIGNSPILKKMTGPALKERTDAFVSLVRETESLNPNVRKLKLLDFIEKTGNSEKNEELKKFVSNYFPKEK